jgi:peptidoglycan/xylan/chitin deacetylase (PgdA/CDA1 family)
VRIKVLPFVANFHGIGHPRRDLDPGEDKVWVDVDRFQQLLGVVESHVGTVPLAITFDDGNESDLSLAAPRLLARGIPATFFVLPGKIGVDGYLSGAQICALSEHRFRIGSHGMNHRDWRQADDEELRNETVKSRLMIQELIGKPVHAAAIPFGAYDSRSLRAVQAAGYNEVFSSDGRPRLSNAWPQPRFSVNRDTTADDLQREIRMGGSLLGRLETELRARAKALR